MNRCTGHCCKKFYLPMAKVEDIKDIVQDAKYIRDMLIKLPLQTHGSDGEPTPVEAQDHYWTCKHFDETSGDCTAYESRPAMCKDYPYGLPCRTKGCTASCALKRASGP